MRAAMRAAMKHAGFTLIEMLMTLVLLGALAAIALPRMSSLNTTQSAAMRDKVVAELRTAAKSAASHRRLVCASLDSGNVVLRIATDNPASACSTVLLSPLGEASRLGARGGLQLSAAPQSTLYFQPNGAVSLDAAGTVPSDFTVDISVDGDAAPVVVVIGRTGAVQ